MNIAFVINSLGRSAGTERVTTMVANELVKRNYNIAIFALHDTGNPFFKLDSNINIQYLSLKPSTNIYLRYPSNVLKLIKLIRGSKIDVVVDVCSAMSLMSIPAKIFTSVKIITWEHFNANVNWNKITSPLARKLASLFSNYIVTLTETDKKVFESRYKAKNVVVIPNPMTLQVGTQPNLNSKIILSIGRFETQKGFDMLIEIWYRCKCRNNGWILKIVGDGQLKDDIIKLIENFQLQDSVILELPTNNVASLYENASIYAMTSRFEGLPLVLIEAMSFGLPIISFDCETGPRDIVVDKTTGLLIDPNDIKTFSHSLDKLTLNQTLLEEYSKNALRLSKKFEIEPIIQLWLNLLK